MILTAMVVAIVTSIVWLGYIGTQTQAFMDIQADALVEAPDTFTVDENGEVHGTTNGITFSQTNVANDFTRLQRFQIEETFWYMSDKGIIRADSDIQALSIYLSK
jgi:hypothetical protein